MGIPNLLAELLVEPRIAGKRSPPWNACVMGWSKGIDVTFSVEPKVNPIDDPQLNRLRRDRRKGFVNPAKALLTKFGLVEMLARGGAVCYNAAAHGRATDPR